MTSQADLLVIYNPSEILITKAFFSVSKYFSEGSKERKAQREKEKLFSMKSESHS